MQLFHVIKQKHEDCFNYSVHRQPKRSGILPQIKQTFIHDINSPSSYKSSASMQHDLIKKTSTTFLFIYFTNKMMYIAFLLRYYRCN